MSGSPKRFLFLIRHPPVAGAWVRETIDMILTCAAFDQFVTVLFLDDGVYHLVSSGSNAAESEPAWQAMLKVLPFYEIHELLVETESLQARGLGSDAPPGFVHAISADTIGTLLAQHDRVVVC